MSIGQGITVTAVALALVLLSSVEVAFRSLSRLQLRDWAERTLRHDRERAEEGAPPPTQGLEETLISLRVARQVTLLGLVVATYQLARGLVTSPAPWLVFGLALALYLVLDKALSHLLVSWIGPERTLRLLRPLVTIVRVCLRPVARLFYGSLRRNRANHVEEESAVSDGGLGAFLEVAEEEGWVSEREEALLRGVAQFGEAIVREVMTPRVDVVCLDADSDLADLRRLVSKRKFSRIPVVRRNIDSVVGIVHLKDLVSALEEGRDHDPVTQIVRPCPFVPETKSIRDLLREFQRERAQMAIVVDEYGGTAGLVTLEDILEEIVGEIQDESEPREETVVADREGVLETVGKAEIDDVEEALGVEIDDDEFETVSGLVFTRLGRVPEPGEAFEYGDLKIEVLEADERRVQRVRITRS